MVFRPNSPVSRSQASGYSSIGFAQHFTFGSQHGAGVQTLGSHFGLQGSHFGLQGSHFGLQSLAQVSTLHLEGQQSPALTTLAPAKHVPAKTNSATIKNFLISPSWADYQIKTVLVEPGPILLPGQRATRSGRLPLYYSSM